MPAARGGARVWVCRSAAAAALALACTAASGAGEALLRRPGQPPAISTVWGIISYTQWPAAAPQVRLCVVGETAYAADLLAGGPVAGNRTVQAQRLQAPEGLAECDALYAGQLAPGQWAQLMAAWPAQQPLLTISEDPVACREGSMFCLQLQASNVGFELNLDAMARSGVRVNPRVFGLIRRKEAP